MNDPSTPSSDPNAELQRLREALRLTASGVAITGADNIFRELVKSLTESLDVDHAFIGVLEPGERDAVHIIAGYFFREFDDDFSYNLQSTPCENVVGQQFRFYPENVQNLFADPHVKELQSEGYAGIPLFGSGGEVLGLMAVLHRQPLQDRELTENLLKIFSVRAANELERRNADRARSDKEQELLKSENRLRATVTGAIDCIIAMDSDGRVIEFNPAAEQCFGYRKFDILGKQLGELIIPERFRDYHEQGMAKFRASGEGAYLGNRVEVTAMRADGSEFPAELAINAAQGHEGEIFIGYLRDITERRKAEEQHRRLENQLRQAQKMEAIGQLTGGIAHDFNNILTAMMGYLVLAGEHAESIADEKLTRYLDRSQRSGQRARELIQQMLTFSRGQHGEPRPVALVPLVREWVGLLESTLPSSVEIRTELDTHTPPVMIDPVHIEQILMNLCINARDAMQGQGTLTVVLRPCSYTDSVCASCRHPVNGEYVEIAVMDSGPGITTEVQERMFEPFYSTKAVGHGSGMGLSMVHGIVHDYGGHLLLDSQPGQGASIRILLSPLSMDACVDNSENASAVKTDVHALTGEVLLIDDEPAVSEFMQDLLEQWGLSVTVFNDSLAACQQFSEELDRFDLVILDQTMPKMTGLEVAEQLLKLRPKLAVILYTGYNADITEFEVKRRGIRALVNKPVDTTQLYNLIEKLL